MMSEELKTWREVFASIPQCPQRQDSLDDQLADLERVANKLGFYDASDYISAANRYIRRQEAKPLTYDDFVMHNCAGQCNCQGCIDYQKSQEAKPLTVDKLYEIAWGIRTNWKSNRLSLAFIGKLVEEIHAAMLPVQPALTEDMIAGILYHNSTDDSEDGKWIEEREYRKIARLIAAVMPRTPSPESLQEILGDYIGDIDEMIAAYNRILSLWGKV